MKEAAKSVRQNKRRSKRRIPPGKVVSKGSNTQRNQGQQFGGERRVVLLDLDGTIMDSTTAWRECSERAIGQLRGILPGKLDQRIGWAAYRAIYECHADIKGKVGPRGHTFEDMRQEWNTRTSYALLLAWAESSRFPPPLGSAPVVPYYQKALKRLLEDKTESALLFEKTEEFRDTWYIECAQIIDRAIEQFWSEHYWTKQRRRYLYPGVKELLLGLRNSHIEYYVATEGHLPTQWRKIRALGLDQKPDPDDPHSLPWISPAQLLATSQAARPHRALQALIGLSEWYRGREAASREALNLFADGGRQHFQLQLTAEASKTTADGLARMAGFFRRLARKISTDASGQVQPEFYIRVLYAINQAPDNPRSHFALAQWKWDDKPCIHLAMVGDKHTSDIAPVLQLARVLGTGIMSVWVRQGSHGREEPEPGAEGTWVECDTIAEAGEKYLLKNEAWLKHTQCIVKPARLFFSAIEPAPQSEQESREQPAEKLEENIQQILAGIGAVRSNLTQNQQSGLNLAMVKTADEVVQDLFGFIVSDVRLSEIREEVIEELLDLCRFPVLRGKDVTLGQCAGLPKATVELLLAIAEETEGDINPKGSYAQCLDVMATLLDPGQVDWAAAVVEILYERPKVVHDQICSSEALSKHYHKQLQPLIHDEGLPNWFPKKKADWLFGRLVRRLDQTDRQGQSPPPSQSRDNVILGQSSREWEYQQHVFLGTDRKHRAVYCSLNGRRIRNIVCICGSPGSGKGDSLDALVMGALRGEGMGSTSVPQSAVVVFHHELAGPCEFVSSAQQSGIVAKVFAFENELDQVTKEYPGLQPNRVVPLRFRLDQLSSEQITRWIGLPDSGALARKFREIYSTLREKKTIEDLRGAVENTTSLEKRQKKQILNALRKLEPVIAKLEETTMSDEVKPGQLLVIDCGRGAGLAARLPAWELAVSALEKHWDSERKDEHFLLVFDELHQSLSQNMGSDAKQLAKRLRGLVDRMGRHQRVSIVAASQSPKDFRDGGELWAAATVLLFHELQLEVEDVPKGRLWHSAKVQFGVSDLSPQEAWYCSNGQDPDYVQVRRRF